MLDSQLLGYLWCQANPASLAEHHSSFLAVHYEYGILWAGWDEEEFEAFLSDLRPSVAAEVYRTHTSLWIVGEDENC